MEILDFEKIADWIEELVNKFNVQDGVFDQFSGEPLRQLLMKKRIKCLKMINFSRDLKAKYFKISRSSLAVGIL